MKKILVHVLISLMLCSVILAISIGYIWKRGFLYLPPRIEQMTYDGNLTYSIDHNVNLSIYNQTGREISADMVLDDKIVFGASIIRDYHFGYVGLSIDLTPGEHTVQVHTVAANSSENRSFTITEGEKKYVRVSVFPDKTGDNVFYKFRVSDKPPIIM